MCDNSNQLDNQRQLAHYQLLVQAWVDTNMERDRTLIQISAAGIGLLVTLLSTVTITGIGQLILYGAGLLLFSTTILLGVVIFRKNANHIESVLSGDAREDKSLKELDKWIEWLFIGALIASIAVAGLAAAEKLNIQGDYEMTKENEKSQRMIFPNEEIQKESLNNIGNLGRTAKPDTTTTPPKSQGGQGDSTSGQGGKDK